jgi:HD-GYP domain-containing protein (c-di-GMP phosphodiesterase class II)
MLVRRITLAALAIGVVFGVIAFLAEKERLGQVVSDRALVATARFNTQAQTLLDASGALSASEFQRELDAFADTPPVAHRFGRYILAAVYDSKGDKLAQFEDASHRAIDDVRRRMDAADHRLDDDDYDHLAFVRVDGQQHVHVAVPLRTSGGEIVAHLEGVFAVSNAGAAEMRRQIATSVGAVFLVVLITSALLYPIILGLLRRLGLMTVDLLDSNLETLKVLGGAVAKRDSDTDAHNFRVTIYSVRLAEALGLPDERIRALIKGAFVHDVGKIAIPDAVLLKPGKLDEDEFHVMKTHVEHGVDIASRSEWLADGAAVVGGHHEKFGGGGYPNGVQGESIPTIARIFAIADVFDAVASRRPYKKSCSYEETMEILEQGRGTHFDPRLLDAFSRIARGLYDEFAGVEGDKLRLELVALTRRYFHTALSDLVREERTATQR